MTEPRIEVLGVYRLNVTAEMVSEQLAILYPPDIVGADGARALVEVQEQLASAVLIEALVRNRDGRFTVDDFGQGLADDYAQAPWA